MHLIYDLTVSALAEACALHIKKWMYSIITIISSSSSIWYRQVWMWLWSKNLCVWECVRDCVFLLFPAEFLPARSRPIRREVSSLSECYVYILPTACRSLHCLNFYTSSSLKTYSQHRQQALSAWSIADVNKLDENSTVDVSTQ